MLEAISEIRPNGVVGLMEQPHCLDTLLDILVEQEIHDLGSRMLPRRGFNRSWDIFGHFLSNTDVRKVYTDAIISCTRPDLPFRPDQIEQRYVGLVYEKMAFEVLSLAAYDNPAFRKKFTRHPDYDSLILLSPTHTRLFTKKLYGNPQPLDEGTEFESYKGVHLQDGILVTTQGDTRKIVGVCEYTCIRKDKEHAYLENKLRGFEERKADPRTQGYFKDAKLVFVTPNSSTILTGHNFKDTLWRKMPFNHRQLRDFNVDTYHRFGLGKEDITIPPIPKTA